MPVPGFAQGVTSQSYWMTHLGGAQTKTAAASTDATKTASAAPASNATAKADAGKSSFWDDVLDVVQVARVLRIGRNTIYELVGRNAIPHRRLGKQIRFSRAAIMRWLDSWSSHGAKERQ